MSKKEFRSFKNQFSFRRIFLYKTFEILKIHYDFFVCSTPATNVPFAAKTKRKIFFFFIRGISSVCNSAKKKILVNASQESCLCLVKCFLFSVPVFDNLVFFFEFFPTIFIFYTLDSSLLFCSRLNNSSVAVYFV